MTKNHKERVETDKLVKRWRKIDSSRGAKKEPRWRAVRKENIRVLKATGIWYEMIDPERYIC